MMQEQHGFTTREEWNNAFQDYFYHIREIDRRNYALMTIEQDCEAWVKNFKQLSQNIRDAYLKTDDFKQQHLYYFTKHPKNWTPEIADALCAYLYRYWHRADDIEVLYISARALLDYYEKRNDEIKIMKCQLVLLSCYHYLDEIHFQEECYRLCESIHTTLCKYYTELSEEDRSMAMSVYDIWTVTRYDNLKVDDTFQKVFDEVLWPQYKNSSAMLERFMQEADMSLPINQAIPAIYENCIRSFASIALYIHAYSLREDQLELVKEQAKRLYFKDCSNVYVYTCDFIAYYMAFRFTLKLPAQNLLQLFMDTLNGIEFSQSKGSASEVNNVIAMLEYFTKLLETLSHECSITQGAARVLERYVRFLLNQPYGKTISHAVDQTLYTYLIPLLKHLNDTHEIFYILLNLTVFRQIQTAIHSLMVGKSATLILTSLIDKAPQQLCGVWGLNRVEDVVKHKEEILKHIASAALLHDVGKVLCSNVINMQYRRITDIEFETIKFHPESSSEILRNIPQLYQYHDIATGHHKSFDGTFGYPKWFDTSQSDQKLFVDLIRICDSLDAATDTYGRLYAKEKSFETVLQELIALKGTSYSDFLVDYIVQDEKLQQDLKQLMEEGREAVYREIYRLIHNSRT